MPLLTKVTDRPSTTAQQGDGTIGGGSANVHSALADSSDLTYVQVAARCRLDDKVVRVGFPAVTLPAGARVYSVELRRRTLAVPPGQPIPVCLHWHRCAPGTATVAGQQPQVRKRLSSTPCPSTTNVSATWVDESLGEDRTGPDGAAWDPATNLSSYNVSTNPGGYTYDLGRDDDTATTLRVAAVYRDIYYQQQSTVTVTGPTSPDSGTRPTVTWTYASPDSQPQRSYRVAIYTQAQYSALGFVPFESIPLVATGALAPTKADSWWVLGEDQRWTVTDDLVDGTYRAYCVDMDTEILTSSGWKYFEEVSVGDQALTLNHDTGLSEWQPITGLNYFPALSRRMLRMEGRNHSSLTTADHRWPVVTRGKRHWKTSETLKVSDYLTLAAPCNDLPVEAKYTDALVELVAWAWTEGNLVNGAGDRPGGLRIYQSHDVNSQHCASIRRALTSLYGPPSSGDMRSLKPVSAESDRVNQRRKARGKTPAWREFDRGSGKTVFLLNSAAAEPIRQHMDMKKVVSCDFLMSLTQAQLKLFIDRSVDADGHWGAGATVLIQRDLEPIRRVEMACALIGVHTNTIRRKDGTHQLTIKRTAASAPIARARSDSNFTAEWVEHEGAVWCPTVPNGTWLARRRGTVYYTGNSQATARWDGSGDDFTTPISFITWTRAGTPASPPPAAVLSSAIWNAALKRVELTFTRGGSSPVTTAFSVQASRDNGVTWQTAPSLRYIPANGATPVTAYDRLAPRNVDSIYRVIAFSQTVLVAATAPSNQVTVHPTADTHRLVHSTNPLLDVDLPLDIGKDKGLKVTLRQMMATYQLIGGDQAEVLPKVVFGPTYGREYDLTSHYSGSDLTDLYPALDQLRRTVCGFLHPDGLVEWVAIGPGAAGRDTEEIVTPVPGDPTTVMLRRRSYVATQCDAPSFY